MSQPEGIYLSVDYRVTDSRTGRVLDDAATKHLTIHYPPDKGGPKALVAYTGVAILPDGTPTGAWIRETLRGESEVVDVSMQHLQARLNRDIARLRNPLIINFLVIQGDRRYFGGMSNLRITSATRARVQRRFGYQMQELTDHTVFGNGAGALSVAGRRRMERLTRQLGVRSKKPADYMNLMALVNREIASLEGSVSPYCHVAFIGAPDCRFGPQSRTFTEAGEAVPYDHPILLFGIDLSGMMNRFMQQSQDFFEGRASTIGDLDTDALNEELKRRP